MTDMSPEAKLERAGSALEKAKAHLALPVIATIIIHASGLSDGINDPALRYRIPDPAKVKEVHFDMKKDVRTKDELMEYLQCFYDLGFDDVEVVYK